MKKVKDKKEILGFSFPAARLPELFELARQQSRSIAGLVRHIVLMYLDRINHQCEGYDDDDKTK